MPFAVDSLPPGFDGRPNLRWLELKRVEIVLVGLDDPDRGEAIFGELHVERSKDRRLVRRIHIGGLQGAELRLARRDQVIDQGCVGKVVGRNFLLQDVDCPKANLDQIVVGLGRGRDCLAPARTTITPRGLSSSAVPSGVTSRTPPSTHCAPSLVFSGSKKTGMAQLA